MYTLVVAVHTVVVPLTVFISLNLLIGVPILMVLSVTGIKSLCIVIPVSQEYKFSITRSVKHDPVPPVNDPPGLKFADPENIGLIKY